jgi:hypothetical protein
MSTKKTAKPRDKRRTQRKPHRAQTRAAKLDPQIVKLAASHAITNLDHVAQMETFRVTQDEATTFLGYPARVGGVVIPNPNEPDEFFRLRYDE